MERIANRRDDNTQSNQWGAQFYSIPQGEFDISLCRLAVMAENKMEQNSNSKGTFVMTIFTTHFHFCISFSFGVLIITYFPQLVKPNFLPGHFSEVKQPR
jgi:hypothetical protein